MLDKLQTKDFRVNVIASLVAVAIVYIFQILLPDTLDIWQRVSAYLSLLCIFLYHEIRTNGNANNSKLILLDSKKPDLAEAIGKCKNSFRFLGISSKRTMSNPIIQKRLVEIGRAKGGEIKILLLNPNGDFLSKRALDEEDSSKAWEAEIRATIERLKELAQNKHIEIEIRLYDRYPVWRLAIIDNEYMQVNFFLKGQQGPQSQLLELRDVENDLFKAYQLEFEKLWETSVDA